MLENVAKLLNIVDHYIIFTPLIMVKSENEFKQSI